MCLFIDYSFFCWSFWDFWNERRNLCVFLQLIIVTYALDQLLVVLRRMKGVQSVRISWHWEFLLRIADWESVSFESFLVALLFMQYLLISVIYYWYWVKIILRCAHLVENSCRLISFYFFNYCCCNCSWWKSMIYCVSLSIAKILYFALYCMCLTWFYISAFVVCF